MFRSFQRVLLIFPALLLCACDNGPTAKQASEQVQRQQPAEKKAVEPQHKAQRARVAVPIGTGFDYYVLSLSWSPTWCAGNDVSGRTEQCAADASHGFIVHGLWPQNETGFPEYCRTSESDRIPERLGRTLFDIMPSMGLIGHEWRKHGSCSGLTQKDYFAVVRAAWDRLEIPPALKSIVRPKEAATDDIETAFLAANPGLAKNAIAITCEARFLEEVRICYNKDLSFRSCPAVDARSCRSKSVTLPPIP
ncbi:ribonuclease [Rhizobium sp. 32-5/1]|uniref:ribonuclease T2 family protein n=1 Tax=Rhizobium sp. 32-5/1 TaxID=3019602 RepID=UPI00240E72B8|nr:ribonuclease [Rhizobium sp. 32-5/1]WEZ83865.1 ribonuclease [Rhizobium sp. 32-5/1]